MKKTTKTVSTATRALLDEMERDAKPSGDKLDRVRSEIFRLRDLEFQRDALAERVKVLSAEAQQIKDKTLVDLFDEAGVNSLGIDADGNMPPYEVEITDYYRANIPEDKREAAFDYLRRIKQEDLIKTTFTVEFGLREGAASDRFARSLEKAGVQYSVKRGVPWNTLTAWFKAEHKRKPLPAKAMELLGATVGRVAKVVKQKEKK
jgi:hypothetical protein